MNLKRLFILGDIGYYNMNLKFCVNNIKNILNSNDVILLLGDNFYPYGIHSSQDNQIHKFTSIFNHIKNPIYSILGNHDYLLNPQSQINHEQWNMPNFYYLKNYSNINLYFLDTNQFYIEPFISKEKIEYVHNKSIDELTNNQLNWLINELKKNILKPKIIFGHYPLLTYGFYYQKMNKLHDLLFPIFQRYNVKAYISGHEHNIQFNTKMNNKYIFKQVIIGSSAENRSDYKYEELDNIYNHNMYDNTDIFYGILTISNDIKIEYVNKYNKIKYSYVL